MSMPEIRMEICGRVAALIGIISRHTIQMNDWAN